MNAEAFFLRPVGKGNADRAIGASPALSVARPIRYAVEQRDLARRDALHGNLRGRLCKRALMRFYAMAARFHAGQLAASDPRLSAHRAVLQASFPRPLFFSQP